MYLKKGDTNREKTRFRGLYALLLMNLVFNLGWSVPAWILLAAHFILKISIWWFASLLIIWFLSYCCALCSSAGRVTARVCGMSQKESESLFRLVELRQGGQKEETREKEA